ncbi:hypothetical protein C8R47DRAFT_1076715 [Mycena vitilis]|nr:hypothetical protein C8R47DRAFT_1076715 [Mycena vitilis]
MSGARSASFPFPSLLCSTLSLVSLHFNALQASSITFLPIGAACYPSPLSSPIFSHIANIVLSKTSGQADSMIGSAKDAVGGAIGSTDMQSKGKAQHASGEGEYKTAETKGYVAGAIDSVTGMAKNTIGAVTGDNTQQAEGKVQQTKGDAQKAANS